MANSVSVAVADRDTIALGLALMVSVEGPDATVTGKVSAFAADGAAPVDLGVLDPHAARASAQQRATSAAARRGEWMDDISCSVRFAIGCRRSRSPGSRIGTPLAFPGPKTQWHVEVRSPVTVAAPRRTPTGLPVHCGLPENS